MELNNRLVAAAKALSVKLPGIPEEKQKPQNRKAAGRQGCYFLRKHEIVMEGSVWRKPIR